MIKIKSIRLERVEDPVKECKSITVDSWQAADQTISIWSNTAPKEGGYDKVDVKLLWEDGTEYKFRFDMAHRSLGNKSIRDEIIETALFWTNGFKPDHISEEQHKALLEENKKISMFFSKLMATTDLFEDNQDNHKDFIGAAYFFRTRGDGSIVGTMWENDGEEALWNISYKNKEEMLKYTGGCHIDMFGCNNLVILDGAKVYKPKPEDKLEKRSRLSL